MAIVIPVVGAISGEGLLISFYTALPILIPVTYLSHIIFYEYDAQKDYVQLFRMPQETCSHGRPIVFAVAIWLSGILAALLINNGLNAFDTASISLVTLAGYYLDKRKNHKAYKALVCKMATLFGRSHG